MRRRITLTLGLALLMLLAVAAAVPAAEEPVGPFPDRIRLSAPAHDPGSIEVSPDGNWVTYYDFWEGKMYAADIATGQRRWLGDFPPFDVEYTPDGAGVVVRIDPAFGSLLRRRNLESGSLEVSSEALGLLTTLFSTTYDGMSVVFDGPDRVIHWWDKDGSVRPLPTVASPGGLGAAPDRDLILYSTYDSNAEQNIIRGLTSTGTETTFGTIDGIAGYNHDKTEFTFLPDQDRVIVSLQLRDGRNLAWGSWILDLVTSELEYAAPGFTPLVSPDGSVAFFEVEDSGLRYGRIVPTETPDQAVDLLDDDAHQFWVHPDWTYVAEAGSAFNVYEIDGTFVRDLNAEGITFTAAFVDEYVVSSRESADIPVFSYPIALGPSERISRAATDAWVLGGHDGFAYWREFKDGTWDIWRAEPNGRWRARITRSYEGFPGDFVEVVPQTGMLVFEAQGSVWAIDLNVIPKYACLNLLATHIGTDGHDIIDGTDGDDVILGLSGNDILRGGEGRDRLCGNHGNDRLVGEPGDDRLRGDNDDDELLGKSGDDIIIDRQGTNDVDGGPGTDTCKVTGVMARCELP